MKEIITSVHNLVGILKQVYPEKFKLFESTISTIIQKIGSYENEQNAVRDHLQKLCDSQTKSINELVEILDIMNAELIKDNYYENKPNVYRHLIANVLARYKDR